MEPTQNKWLLVEGADDLYSVVALMQHHVNWPPGRDGAPVWIRHCGGADEILAKDFIPAMVKSRNITTLGVMLDADSDANSRFSSFRNLCVDLFPDIPKQAQKSGLITNNEDGKRMGLWIMPDNIAPGAIEIFLKHLVPDRTIPEWEHATKCVATAKEIGAGYKNCHVDKANLYTWLAWQDEPGQSPGRALTRKILDPKSPSAGPFIKWFMELYSLQLPANLPGLG